MWYVFEVGPADVVPGPYVRLDLFLARKTQRTRALVQWQILRGVVQVNSETVPKAAFKLKTGDVVRADFIESEASNLNPVAHPLDILFEDESFLALNKEQGTVVHPAAGHRGDTLVHYLLHHLRGGDLFQAPTSSRPGIVHRLDRGTSGVLLVAKTRAAQENLSLQFKSRSIKKEYEAITWGKMPTGGRFESEIGRDRADRKKMSSRTAQGRTALTLWQKMRAFAHFTHVALFPHTGRTHQLRVHLSEGGHPIVGDGLYGKGATGKRVAILAPELKIFLSEVSQTFLHARALHLLHPVTGNPLTVIAPPPPVFTAFLQNLEKWDQ